VHVSRPLPKKGPKKTFDFLFAQGEQSTVLSSKAIFGQRRGCVPTDGPPLGIATAAFELGKQSKVVSIGPFTCGSSSSVPAHLLVPPSYLERRSCSAPTAVITARADLLVRSDLALALSLEGTVERARTVPRPAHGRAPPTQVLGTASSPAHRVRSCDQVSVQR
jgi:hypothetical protein